MPTTTQVEREERRGLVGFLHALGFGEAVITDLLRRGGQPVSIRTVGNDLVIIRKRGGSPLDGPAATAQIRAVFNQLWAPIQGVLSNDERDPPLTLAQRVGLTESLWGAYLSRIRFEQAFGAVPKEPEKVAIEVELGKNLTDLFQAMAGRMSPEGVAEFTKSLRSVKREQSNLVERLGLSR